MPRISRDDSRRARHGRLRKKVAGTNECPRLLILRTLHHIYAFVVDDAKGHTLVAASTRDKSVGESLGSKTNVDAAKAVGQAIAAKPKRQASPPSCSIAAAASTMDVSSARRCGA